MLVAKDITEDWVKANFDIYKERKKLNKKSDYYDCSSCTSYDYIPVSEFVKRLYEKIETYREYAKAPAHASVFIDIGVDYDRDGEQLRMNIIFKWTELETDEQVVKRLIRKEKIESSARENKEKAKIVKEEKDKREYKRLKKKYK